MRIIKKMKIAVALLIVFSINLIMWNGAGALAKQTFISVKVNGNCIKMDTQPYVKNFRTYVPVRFVAEALGANVEWVGEDKKVVLTQESKKLELFLGSNELFVNGEKVLMDTYVETFNDRTMVPVRFVAENLDCSVEWDEQTYSAVINKNDADIPTAYIDTRPYTDEDVVWLARIVTVEAMDLSIDGKVAVANVVLNRIKSPLFPDSVYDVIFDKEYTVQFPPAYKEGFKDIVPYGDSVISAKMALEGINNVEECLFFNHVPFESREDKFYKRIDTEYFYY